MLRQERNVVKDFRANQAAKFKWRHVVHASCVIDESANVAVATKVQGTEIACYGSIFDLQFRVVGQQSEHAVKLLFAMLLAFEFHLLPVFEVFELFKPFWRNFAGFQQLCFGNLNCLKILDLRLLQLPKNLVNFFQMSWNTLK